MAPQFSFLLPTRGRPDLAKRFLDSVVQTTCRPEDVEVVFCVDEDDEASLNLSCEGLDVKTVTVPPGFAMGALNRTCFEASSGRFVMLINDDVIIRTRGWDREV